jgi:hypothetical protein
MTPDVTDARLMSLRVQAALKRIVAIQERIDQEVQALQRPPEIRPGSDRPRERASDPAVEAA